MRIHQLIEELSQVKPVTGHKAALDISRILDGNRKLFAEHIDPVVLHQLLSRFIEMAEARPSYHASESFRREFETAYGTLMFYLRKVI
jgi:hypothetical protein